MSHVTDLAQRWRSAVRGAGAPAGTDAPAIDAAGADLLRRWAESHRHYHTVDHLAAMLSVVDELAAAARDADAVRLAAWTHDAIYDPRAGGGENERASAALAGAVLGDLRVPPPAVAEVVRLVELTATHDPPPWDRNGAVLCDADLAVLARPPEDYDRYAAAIRREYAHVSDEVFRAGRAAVLSGLLSRSSLFRVNIRWEPAARANLHRELVSLRTTA
ncbi:MAG TPA: metal-dependent phosphohydrolase [Micromonosporaceae bacterium]|jgi:predicted metal-dependent HD superfamily phosphohydrolase|nr:metal-dependent phosphohydrolase [Micromonosporaceae bacterium]